MFSFFLKKALKHTGDDSAAELSIDNVGGVFVVLGGGIAIAFLIAAAEFMWNVRKIAVNRHMTVKGAVMMELKFAMNFAARKKAVNGRIDDSNDVTNEENKKNHSTTPNNN